MAISRFNRANFFDTMTNEENEVLTDPVSFFFNDFIEYMRDKDVLIKRIAEADEGAPDLISFKYYGTEEYWWIICFINKIQDPMNELVAGTRIAIPFLKDVEEFKQKIATSKSRGQSVILR